MAEERRYASSRQSKGSFTSQVAAGCSSATDVAARVNPSFIATPHSELIPHNEPCENARARLKAASTPCDGRPLRGSV